MDSNLETIATDEFLDSFMASLKKLQVPVHDFISKMQAMFVTEMKDSLKNNEYLVICDFLKILHLFVRMPFSPFIGQCSTLVSEETNTLFNNNVFKNT